MIDNQHQITGFESPIHSSRCVADEESLDPEVGHCPYRKRGMVGRMTFVKMGPPPERNGRNAIQQPGSNDPGVPLYTRGRKTWNIAERNLVSTLEAICQTPKARSEN